MKYNLQEVPIENLQKIKSGFDERCRLIRLLALVMNIRLLKFSGKSKMRTYRNDFSDENDWANSLKYIRTLKWWIACDEEDIGALWILDLGRLKGYLSKQ